MDPFLIHYGYCLLYSIIFVILLYAWPSGYGRDHYISLRRRFVMVAIASTLNVFIVACHSLNISLLEPKNWNKVIYFDWSNIFIRSDYNLPAILYPLALTMILFSGPLFAKFLDEDLFSVHYWRDSLHLRNVRNVLVSPFSEELVFRGCILYHLLQIHSCFFSIVFAPIYFGVAHLHHMIEKVRFGRSFSYALQESMFQVFYTTVFGMYSGFILLRTRHLLSAVFVHMFCNIMGFPDFDFSHHSRPIQFLLMAFYGIGLLGFCYYLLPLTQPSLFGVVDYCDWRLF